MLKTKPTIPPPTHNGNPVLDIPSDIAADWLIAPEPTVCVVRVTPQLANVWLEFNIGNRRPKTRESSRYARDMDAGAWRLTGESIKFSRTGRMIDGQNRLLACIEADAPFVTYVHRGLEDVAQRVMDTGVKRTANDDLAMHGEKNSALVAATIRLALTAREAGIERMGSFSVSNTEVAQFLERHPELREAAEVAREVARQIDAYPSVVAYAYWQLSKIDADEAYEFFTTAASRVGLADGDPILAMTKRFAEARRNREKLPHGVQLSVIYRVWNSRREGKTMRFVRVKSPKDGGDVPIPHPK